MGSHIEVHVDNDGVQSWSDAVVVAVWHDGSFRVQVASDCEWVEDFTSPASVEGRRLLGREWRRVRAAPAAPAAAVAHAADRTAQPCGRGLRSRGFVHGAGEDADADASDNSGDAAGTDGWLEASESAKELGRSLVGQRVSVWWEEDAAWYSGQVRSFGEALGEHLVCYDDGEQVHEALDECCWKLSAAAVAHAADRTAQPCGRGLRSRGFVHGAGEDADADASDNSGDAAGTDGWLEASESAKELGRSLVGQRVSVWWEEDAAWYSGQVRSFGEALGEHLVCYDDGEQVHEALDECCWKLLDNRSSVAQRSRRSRRV